MPASRPTRSPSVRPPRLYLVRDIPRQRRADHVDCEDGTCGVCDLCIHEQFTLRFDHPAWLPIEEAVRL